MCSASDTIASDTAGNTASIKLEIVVAKALGVIGRKGEANPAVGERLRHHANRDQFGDIVSRSRNRQLLENWKIASRPATGQPTPQTLAARLRRGGIAQIGIGAIPQVLIIGFAALAR